MDDFFRQSMVYFKLLLSGSTAVYLIYDLISNPEKPSNNKIVPASPDTTTVAPNIAFAEALIPYMQVANFLSLFFMLVLVIGRYLARRN